MLVVGILVSNVFVAVVWDTWGLVEDEFANYVRPAKVTLRGVLNVLLPFLEKQEQEEQGGDRRGRRLP